MAGAQISAENQVALSSLSRAVCCGQNATSHVHYRFRPAIVWTPGMRAIMVFPREIGMNSSLTTTSNPNEQCSSTHCARSVSIATENSYMEQ